MTDGTRTEARNPSRGLRDIVIEANYRKSPLGPVLATDTVKATGVWAKVNDDEVLHDKMWDTEVFRQWPDFPHPPRARIVFWGGVGIRPFNRLRGFANVIAIRFTLSPPGIGNYRNVAWDITRQVDAKDWSDFGAGWEVDEDEDFPTVEELPNDDHDSELNQTHTPTADRMYVEDAPGGYPDRKPRQMTRTAWRMNALEFIRVRFDGKNPTNDVVDGSRASEPYRWHVRTWLVNYDGAMDRRDHTDAENQWNDIGPGHITLGGDAPHEE